MIKRTICIETPCHLKCRNEQMVLSYDHIKGYESLLNITNNFTSTLIFERMETKFLHITWNQGVKLKLMKPVSDQTVFIRSMIAKI